MAGMNLQLAVSGPISAVNPDVLITVTQSNGYATGPDGKSVPAYFPPVAGVKAQVQPLSWRDIEMVSGLNLQGTRRKIWVQGEMDGIVRVTMKGGDLIALADGSVYLVALVSEQWAQWCSCLCSLQDGS